MKGIPKHKLLVGGLGYAKQGSVYTHYKDSVIKGEMTIPKDQGVDRPWLIWDREPPKTCLACLPHRLHAWMGTYLEDGPPGRT